MPLTIFSLASSQSPYDSIYSAKVAALQKEFGYSIQGRTKAAKLLDATLGAIRFQLAVLKGLFTVVALLSRGLQVGLLANYGHKPKQLFHKRRYARLAPLADPPLVA